MARRKRKPQRTCIACKEVKEKRELVRIVRTPEKKVILDPTGKANGRGVYLCRTAACWDKGLKKEHLSYVLKVTVSSADINTLQHALQTEFSNK